MRQRGDADSLVAGLLLADEPAAQVTRELSRIELAGYDNAKALWLVSLGRVCDPSSNASNDACDRTLKAPKRLVVVASGNAMAWLTLAFLADRAQTGTEVVISALRHALASPNFHDYGFDLARVAIVSTASPSFAADFLGRPGRPMSTEEARLDFLPASAVGASSAGAPIVSWLMHGCGFPAAEVGASDGAEVCTKARKLLERGDSQLTLASNREAMERIKSSVESIRARKKQLEQLPDNEGRHFYAKTMIDSYEKASSDQQYWSRFAEALGAHHGS